MRDGFGVFTLTNLGPLSFNNSGNPTSNLHTYTNGLNAAGQPLIQFPNTAPAQAGAQFGSGNLDQGVDPNYRDPRPTSTTSRSSASLITTRQRALVTLPRTNFAVPATAIDLQWSLQLHNPTCIAA